MTMRGTRRKVVVLAAAGMGAVLVFAGLKWREIAVQYHLHRMRGHPEYWLEAAGKPQGSVPFETARRFLDEEGSFVNVLGALERDESSSARQGAQQRANPPLLRLPMAQQNDAREDREATANPEGPAATAPR